MKSSPPWRFIGLLCLLISSGVWFASRVTVRQGDEIASLELDRNELARHAKEQAATIHLLRAELAATEAEIAARISSQKLGASNQVVQVASWIENYQRVYGYFASRPELKIPEMQLLTEQDWLQLTRAMSFSGDEEQRKSLAEIRRAAREKFSYKLAGALKAYLEAHGNAPPERATDLLPYFRPSIDPSLLQNYTVLPPDQRTLAVKSETRELRFDLILSDERAVDLEFDSIFRVGPMGPIAFKALQVAAENAIAAYSRAHGGEAPVDPAQLIPYLSQSVDPARLRPYLR